MARKTKIVTIQSEGRDKGRAYQLTEMPATQAEDWASRALFAIGKSNPDLPDNVTSAGMAGVAALGIRALASIPWAEAEPLLAEMFTCIQYVPDPSRPSIVRPLIEDDIEEVATRVMLRAEVASLHLGFSIAAELSKLGAALKKFIDTRLTPTSHPGLAPS
ncbi:hypothetical protein [Sphingomonas sp.]|uniref:hypothetical protein n=1 Tax=Sphingomonas sp. TaxID=28214 RepID=UPI0025EF1C48|nr:hypothetical protein [Sphingomonas sp.]MBV9527835.1 hypothetical protein [Sphingomonas sp.]